MISLDDWIFLEKPFYNGMDGNLQLHVKIVNAQSGNCIEGGKVSWKRGIAADTRV